MPQACWPSLTRRWGGTVAWTDACRGWAKWCGRNPHLGEHALHALTRQSAAQANSADASMAWKPGSAVVGEGFARSQNDVSLAAT